MFLALVIFVACLSVKIHASNKLVTLPRSITSLLEADNFFRDPSVPFSFVNINGNLKPDQIKLFASRNASFISYSPEFTALIGQNPQLKLIERRDLSLPFAHEGGAYIPETNEIWFTANQLPVQNTNVTGINLSTNKVTLLNINPPITTPNGVNYFEGLAYVCSQGDKTTPAGIYAVNPKTLVSRPVVNSWFGFRLNSPNDVAFSTKIAGKKFMWFTDPQVAFLQDFSNQPQYRSTVFRYDFSTADLRPVITDLAIPNGIAFNQKETVLYVTDTYPDQDIRIVYAYDLTADGLPINRRIFSVSSFGIPDGIRVDKKDRVWIAEGDGLNVRDRYGTVLGVILGYDLSPTGLISNFGWMKNTIILLVQESLWRLDL